MKNIKFCFSFKSTSSPLLLSQSPLGLQGSGQRDRARQTHPWGLALSTMMSTL